MLVADPTPVSAVTTLDDLTETANTAQLVSFSDFFTFLLFLAVQDSSKGDLVTHSLIY